MERFKLKKNFNIASTVINEQIRVSTAAIFYSDFFGEWFQFETFIFLKKGPCPMKIHKVSENQKGIDYCLSFHKKAVSLVKSKIK